MTRVCVCDPRPVSGHWGPQEDMWWRGGGGGLWRQQRSGISQLHSRLIFRPCPLCVRQVSVARWETNWQWDWRSWVSQVGCGQGIDHTAHAEGFQISTSFLLTEMLYLIYAIVTRRSNAKSLQTVFISCSLICILITVCSNWRCDEISNVKNSPESNNSKRSTKF